MNCIEKLLRFLLPVIGLVCILIPGHVTWFLPLLLGGAMVLTGLIRGALYLRSGEFLTSDDLELGQYIILVIMGVAFLSKGTDALGLMGTTWGLLGLRRAAGAINEALRRHARHQRVLLASLDAGIRTALSLALLFDPFQKFTAHIVLLGLELILANIRLPREKEA